MGKWTRIRLIVDKKEIPLDHLGIEDHCQFLLASTVSIKVLLQKIDKTLLLLTTFTTFLLREHIKKYGWMEVSKPVVFRWCILSSVLLHTL